MESGEWNMATGKQDMAEPKQEHNDDGHKTAQQTAIYGYTIHICMYMQSPAELGIKITPRQTVVVGQNNKVALDYVLASDTKK